MSERQHVEKVPGSRRARLTPVPGTDTAPELPVDADEPASAPSGERGPNDDRMRREKPPHY
ncbi:hypothetical protein [Microbacterium sp. GXF7504]